MKKLLSVFVLVLAAVVLVACQGGGSDSGDLTVIESYSARDISEWTGSVTPDGTAHGTATYSEDSDVAIVKVPQEGDGQEDVEHSAWGGIQSPIITLDFSNTIYAAIQIQEVNDDYVWAVKFVPEDPIEGHEWGFYVFEDNQGKYDNYLMTNLNEKFTSDLIDAYGGSITGRFWLWAAGGATAEFEVRQFVLFNGSL